MQVVSELKEALLHFLFPHVCEGCGTDVLEPDHFLCLKCLSSLPKTAFQLYPDNPVEKLFWGRLPVAAATAEYYFATGSLMQHLMHRFKYRGNKEIGVYLGRQMGFSLKQANRFAVWMDSFRFRSLRLKKENAVLTRQPFCARASRTPPACRSSRMS